MSTIRTWREGLRRVRGASALVLLLWTFTIGVTAPPALLLDSIIRTQLGSSVEADAAADGMNYDWLQEFRAQGGPIAPSLGLNVIGFAAVVDNASALADMRFRSAAVVFLGLAFAGLVWFLSPGLICRVAADRQIGAGPFLGICGSFLPRMARLALISLVVYGGLFASVHPWLFDDLFDRITRDMTVERTAFFVRLGLYGLFFLMVAGVNVLFDYTRVRMVVEDRRSVIAALSAAARFIRKNARVALGVYVLNIASFVLVVGGYALLAPGAGATEWTAWSGFLVAQLYVAARVAVKLAFWGSEAAVLQMRFGCPGFVRSLRDPRSG